MPDWSIKIVPSRRRGGPAAFVPDLKGAKPGQALVAQVDDLVTWNNTTNDAHWPWPADASYAKLPDDKVSQQAGNYLSNQIQPGLSSRPSYDVVMPAAGTTIYYCCKLHPEEHGMITVTAIPSPLPTTSSDTGS